MKTIIASDPGIEKIPDDIDKWPRRRAVLWLVRQTVDAPEIAGIIDTSSATVRTIMSELRKEGYDIPLVQGSKLGRSGYEIRSRLPAVLVGALNTAAADRHERPTDLARRILSTVLSNGMVDAVLDDK